ncbi:MAG: hypothetical protein ABI696_05785, partial [Rubrivivax sp.]
MHFQDVREGAYRIYVGALESPGTGGYTAALAVQRVVGAGHDAHDAARDAFRDDSLACGHRWSSPEDAMSYALRKGRAWVRART